MATAREMGAVSLGIEADDSDFKRVSARTTRSIQEQGKEFRRLNLRLKATNTGFRALQSSMRGLGRLSRVAALGAGGLVAAFALVANRSKAAVTALGNTASESLTLADTLGISTENLEALTAAMGDAGVTSNQTASGLRAFARNLNTAASGANIQSEALARIGLEARDLLSLGIDEAFFRFTEALNLTTTGSERLAVAQELLGGRGAALVGAVDGNVTAFRRLRDELQANEVLSNEQLRDIAALNDSYQQFSRSLDRDVNRSIIRGAEGWDRWARAAQVVQKSIRAFTLGPLGQFFGRIASILLSLIHI